MSNIEKFFTGERFIPGIEDIKLKVEHYQRYMSMVDLIKGKIILDAACGEGYGSYLLAEFANSVIGVDISESVIFDAQKKYASYDNLRFQVGSIESLPIETESIDIVISFETIEHVEEEIQNKFLAEIRRVLKPQGVLIMSTPNKAIYTDLYNYHNEFHKKEFYKEEFINFLKSSFQNIELYNQFFEVSSVIDNYDNGAEQIKFFREKIRAEQEGKYYIALASNGNLPEVSIASVYAKYDGEYDNNIQRIISLQQEEEIRNIHINKLNSKLLEKGYTIKELQEEVTIRNTHIKKLDIELETVSELVVEKNKKIHEQSDQIENLNITLEQMNVELKKSNDVIVQKNIEQENYQNKVVNLENKQKCLQEILDSKNVELEEKKSCLQRLGDTLREKENKVHELEDKVCDLQQVVCNKEGHIEILLEAERVFEREKKTKAYKFSKYIQKVGNAILPLESKRRFFLRILFNVFKSPKLMFYVIRPARIKNYIKYVKKEGMEGVKNRYEEALEKERSYRYPETNIKLDLEEHLDNPNNDSYDYLEFYNYDNPLVSIVIPVYNEFSYTYNCLKSIYKNTDSINYEIIVADDCSTDFTARIKEKIKNIKVVNTNQNAGFLINCNNAAKYARGKYLLFLNNDTQVQCNWLEPLITLIESDSTIGMVGSKLIYADGRLQEAGGIVWKDASAWNYGHLLNPDLPEFNYVKEVDYISGAAIMIRYSLWNEIGGFDERYVPAYYEDTDLAFEVRKHGYKVMYQPLSRVVHFEGISNGTDEKEGIKQYQVVNLNKFHKKWKTVLEMEHTENGNIVFKAKDRSIGKKHILVVDHYVPNHDKDAGGKCTYMYLKLFVHLGFKVTFIGDNFYNHEPYTTELNQMGIEVLYGNYYYNNWESWLKENGRFFNYIYLQRPHISIKYIDLVKEYSDAKIFYFAHDLHHIREYREYELTNNIEKLKSSEHWKKIEYELFEKADVGHVVGSYEQKIMQDAFVNKPIRNIPLYIYEDIINYINKDFSTRHDLIYVGGFGHPPNIDSVLWFAKEVFPKVLEKYPDIKWHVVGGKVPKEIANLADEHIIIEGFVPDEQLDLMYRECRMAVVPLRVGAGVKGKVVEAAYYQIPLVTTTIGAEGLDKEIGNFVVVDDAKKMAQLIVKLYEKYDELKSMSDAGKRFIEENFTLKVAENVITMDINV